MPTVPTFDTTNAAYDSLNVGDQTVLVLRTPALMARDATGNGTSVQRWHQRRTGRYRRYQCGDETGAATGTLAANRY
jgi:hypothetical protein